MAGAEASSTALFSEVVTRVSGERVESSTSSSTTTSCATTSSTPPEEGNIVNVGDTTTTTTTTVSPWNKLPSSDNAAAADSNDDVLSWPALSESTARVSSNKSLPPSESQGHLNTHPEQIKQGNANADQNSRRESTAPIKQKPIKHNSSNRQAGFSRGTPTPLARPVFPVPEPKHVNQMGPIAGTYSSVGQPRPMGGYVPHPRPANDHPSNYGSHRQGNSAATGRGDGRFNYQGGRHDHNRGKENRKYEKNASQSHHGHGHRPQVRGVMMGPPVQGVAPFAPPPVYAPFGNQMFPNDVSQMWFYLPPEHYMAMPYSPVPPPMSSYSDQGYSLNQSIVKQVEYYFSDANLVKDVFLRSNMDGEGWVPVSLVAGFRKVRDLTLNISFLLQCLRDSSVIEIQGDKMRRRVDWKKWILHSQAFSEPGKLVAGGSAFDELATSMKRASLEEASQVCST